ncbi:MAG: 4Fe-4S binding protein [Symploca sp. SIO3C6]|uniref:4Fe-4S binding protein n=1 Tax=Symploca sp. SIO1C4 TaxID=2607765 RepID=A0A6B3N675_9CYAN|nr:4Fe-4S binding protein [Symploca sp. SIO3C6]NER29226.1 4Fe-4S binding protein [Symploca sp. SIO1C4]
MFTGVSERNMHLFRWVLIISWLLLIVSLFYDPISTTLTDPNNLLSPLRDGLINRESCVLVQGECLIEEPYQVGARVFWGMVVPCAIMIVLVFGHETWRRICPLYFLSQIPRALGLKPLLNIDKNYWLTNNHLYLQFALFFIGLNCRILFVNSDRVVLALFLILTIVSAVTMVFIYGGRSWCHYVCPFGMVQTVFTGPRGLLGTKAHQAPPRTITQSMCRSVDATTGKEKSTCINCKSPCLDIDSEKAYWNQLTKSGRRLIQYGYLGLVIGYFAYYWLYAGNFDYYLSGAWTHEPSQLATLFNPGFYIFGQPIAIPKLVAAPLTLAFFVVISYLVCTRLEKLTRAYVRKKNLNISTEQILHRFFSICTFLAFNIFFIYGGRPEIMRFPIPLQFLFQSFVVLVSSIWLYRTWGRSNQKYTNESLANSFRRQLKKFPLDFSQFLEGRSLDDLKPDELGVLSKVLPNFSRQEYFSIYKGVLQEALEARHFSAANSLEVLESIRQKLSLNEKEHYQALTELSKENPYLLYISSRQSPFLERRQPRLSEQSSLSEEPTQLRKGQQVSSNSEKTELR